MILLPYERRGVFFRCFFSPGFARSKPESFTPKRFAFLESFCRSFILILRRFSTRRSVFRTPLGRTIGTVGSSFTVSNCRSIFFWGKHKLSKSFSSQQLARERQNRCFVIPSLHNVLLNLLKLSDFRPTFPLLLLNPLSLV